MWDALIMNTLGMNVAVGSVLLLQQAPAIFPGGNMVLAVIIGTLIMAFTLLWVYSEFAGAMPSPAGITCSSAVPCTRSSAGCCRGARASG
jgi:amino acid transporter